MERGRKLKLTAGAAVGLAAVAAAGALAATQLGSPRAENDAILKDAAKRLGVQPSALATALRKALEDRVDAAVAGGRLTKAEGKALKKQIGSGNVPLFEGAGRRRFDPGPPFGHVILGPGLHAATSYLGLTAGRLRSQLASGKSLAQIAKDQGKSVNGLVRALTAFTKRHLDAAVSSGRLTKSQESRILSEVKDHLTMLVNGRLPRLEGPPGLGRRFAPGPGGFRRSPHLGKGIWG